VRGIYTDAVDYCPRQGLCICIPTYKRANLLKLLLEDLARQCCHPETLIIVDGDPESNEVAQIMDGIATSGPEGSLRRIQPREPGVSALLGMESGTGGES
jgi:hypothetical protein